MTNPNIWEADVLPQKNKKTEPTDLVIAAKCTPTGAYVGGLTLREYFAAMAMTAAYMYHNDNGNGKIDVNDAKNFSKSCVAYADSLIIELNQEAK